MFKLALGIEYDGTHYIGWQRQNNGNSIQQNVEKALSNIANHPVTTVCAGRTDKGVHALNQVIHCEVHAKRSYYNWLRGVNSNLDGSIRILWVKEVPQEFNARHSALSRHYTYVINNSKIHSAILKNFTAWYYQSLNIELMQQASMYWLGEHDFSSFRCIECQSKTPIRNIKSIKITHRMKNFVIIDIVANGFLHHMVRNMVGVLLMIGAAKKQPFWAQEVLLAKDRTKAAITAQASGLFLNQVYYPKEFAIPYNSNFHLLKDLLL